MIYKECEWTIFFDSGDKNIPSGDVFGASCVAATGAVWDIKPKGIVITGEYKKVLTELSILKKRDLKKRNVDTAILFFSLNNCIEDFLNAFSEIFPDIPACGACASPCDDGISRIYPDNNDVSILLINDDRFIWNHEWKNLHKPLDGKLEVKQKNSRTITEIIVNDISNDASNWYLKECEKQNCSGTEQISLINPEGYNIHISFEGKSLHTGTDVYENQMLGKGLLKQNEAFDKVQKACIKKNSLYFGCAGLYGLIHSLPEIGENSQIGFFHGEVITTKSKPRFANLMISGLVTTGPA